MVFLLVIHYFGSSMKIYCIESYTGRFLGFSEKTFCLLWKIYHFPHGNPFKNCLSSLIYPKNSLCCLHFYERPHRFIKSIGWSSTKTTAGLFWETLLIFFQKASDFQTNNSSNSQSREELVILKTFKPSIRRSTGSQWEAFFRKLKRIYDYLTFKRPYVLPWKGLLWGRMFYHEKT